MIAQQKHKILDIATSCLLYFWEMWLVLFVCTESISANAFYDICQFFSSVVPNSKDHRVPMGKGYQLNISHGHLKRNIIQNTWALLPTAKSTQYLWSNVSSISEFQNFIYDDSYMGLPQPHIAAEARQLAGAHRPIYELSYIKIFNSEKEL